MTARHLALYAAGHTPARLELRSGDGTIIRTYHTAPARRLHEHAARAARARRAAHPRRPRGPHPTTLARWARRHGIELTPAQAALWARAAEPVFPRNPIAIAPHLAAEQLIQTPPRFVTLPPIHDPRAIARIHPTA